MDKLSCFKQTALISALMLEMTQGAQAATINVDGANCTLHDAIVSANSDVATGGCVAGNGDDELQLPIDGVFELQTPLDSINNNLTIHGNGSTITRSDTAPAFKILQGSFIDLTLNDTNISGGQETINHANRGGGISLSFTTLTMNRSIVSGNTGGGIYIYGAYPGSSINYSVIESNSGLPNATRYSSGLTLLGGELTINHSTIANNTTMGSAKGGGLYIANAYFDRSDVIINNSTISGNSSLAGGGGLDIRNHYFFYVQTSTIVTLNQTTIVTNSTSQDGGAIFNGSNSRTNIVQSLISGNSANLVNEILNAEGTVATNNFNLIGLNGQASVVGVNIGPTDGVPTETNLSDLIVVQLKDNGGSTPTHALNPSGVAVDFIPEINCLTAIDQTGSERPIDGDGDGVLACDVGAFENVDVIFKDGFDGA